MKSPTKAPASCCGWVYVLTNPAMPGLVKIGLTTRNPSARAAELTAATGVPAPFVIAWCRAVSDCAFVESAVHRLLDDRRASGKREFFRCDVKTARQVIEAAAGAKLGRHYLPPRPMARRRSGKGRGRYRGDDSLPALLALSGVVLVAVLALFRPPLPDWLPAPVLQAFTPSKG
jgi:T5orf172 domain